MDRCLLTALVDRWRNETNTFHMPQFEMTITLENVAYILGLRVIGKAVTGKMYKEAEDILGMVLGQHPSNPTNTKALRSGCVKLTWLRNQFSHLQSNASEIDVIRATRAYLLHLLGTTIFANTSGNMVSVSYLPLLADFVECAEYAWGAATLAFLYRALMRASRKNTANIGGSMTLFTVWAYERLGVGRPDVVRLCRPFPRSVRWKCRRRTDNIHNCYRPYRQELDQLKECEEFERQLAAKEASLPQEPASDDDNAVTLLVRMPDGSRRGRRFLNLFLTSLMWVGPLNLVPTNWPSICFYHS
ncbi:protein MAIN-LIKE 1-like isoform X4 [Macadamia integrifolia]|uniref:protein MAIN-LIKE 1-like isoform X4 n=1 Tax=Macadamia integrifolia TaxID=60698 RepID=UPI001C4F8214|nr:protein MAIN-LIKE 1-like isoform X4 [Macadamia integrifolia]